MIKILQKETTNKRNMTLILIIRLSCHAIECAECSLSGKNVQKDVRGEINGLIYDTTRSIHSQSYTTPLKLKERDLDGAD